ncbi:MAG: hypothetical protein CVT66_10605 [Actinobacteria bacterium HGW-Actinobacteria-6]|jgi:hypothetical protein|nr:MAG: hypothetical protein CVT66_10605 [Actinobacteria bacterium HGW-Actinobacteria-6]
MFSAAITESVDEKLRGHLTRPDDQEDVCFALYFPSNGRDRASALIGRVVLPLPGERSVHGNASFTSDYFLRSLVLARQCEAGLALLHSHPDGHGWQDMSNDDVEAERSHAAQALAATGLPLVGLTLAADTSWSCRRWIRVARSCYQRDDAVSVRVVGDRLKLTFHPMLRPAPDIDGRVERTVSAWGGTIQADLGRMRVGIVGVGSVGSHVAEALARTGVGEIRLIDFDSVEYRNLDRLLHATRFDVALARSKVEVLGEALVRSASATRFKVESLEMSVCEEAGYRAALDCDLLFCCVDRPWPRFVLNVIAYAHLIPVVDGGIFVDAATNPVRMRGADWRAHVAGPGRKCLECSGQYAPGDVAADRCGDFDDPAYIKALASSHQAKHGENVFAFSVACASLEVLQALTMIVGPAGVGNIGGQHYHMLPGTIDTVTDGCAAGCPYSETLMGLGESANARCTCEHVAARDEIAARRARQRRPLTVFGRLAARLLTACSSLLEALLSRNVSEQGQPKGVKA